MSRALTLVGVLVLTGISQAQERVDQETARKYAQILTASAKLENAPLKFDVDADKPFALRKDELGAMVIPDKLLTADLLTKAANDAVPVAHLWMRKLTVVVKDQPAGNDRLRIVTVRADDQEHDLPLFLLGARKKGNDLELVIFTQGKEPLLQVPLRKMDGNQELPIEMEGRGENGRGTLTLNVLGKYRAEIPLAAQE